MLKEVFGRYSKPPTKPKGENDEKVCGRSGLNAFAKDTNGEGELESIKRISTDELKPLSFIEMTDETYNEIVEYLDVTEEGELTFKGFIQLYQLQTGELTMILRGDRSIADDMSSQKTMLLKLKTILKPGDTCQRPSSWTRARKEGRRMTRYQMRM